MAFWIPYIILSSLGILANWPGRANPDTIDMLYQAHELNALNDWHAPFVTFNYALLAPVFGSPGGALVIQAIGLMLWPAVVFSTIMRGQANTPIRFAAFGLWTIICAMFIALAGQIVKDVFLLCCLSSLLTCMSYASRAEQRENPFLTRIGVATSLIAIVLVRPPNIIIVILAMIIILAVLQQGNNKRWFRPTAIYSAIGILVTWLATTYYLLPAQRATPSMVLYTFDIAGMSMNTKTDLFLQVFAEGQRPSKTPWECYSAKSADVFFWGDCSDYRPLLEANKEKLRSVWLRQIVANPRAYLLHRMRYSAHLMSLDNEPRKVIVPGPPLFNYATNHPDFVGALPQRMIETLQLWKPTIAYVPFGAVAHLWFQGPFGRPLVWVIVLLIGAWFGAYSTKSRRDPILLIVTLGGIGNVGLFCAVGPSDDLRYLLPSMFCAVVTTVQLVRCRKPASM
jgi:hypothetical protein